MATSRETFERGPVLDSLDSALPAATYNLTRILLSASPTSCVFVPIRAMQYLAVIDREEIIFVDSQYRRWVEVAWRDFNAQARDSLEAAVSYRVVFHTPEGRETQRRLQAELPKALALLDERRPASGGARVLALKRD